MKGHLLGLLGVALLFEVPCLASPFDVYSKKQNTNQQFDPRTYVYVKGDKIPKNEPDPAPGNPPPQRLASLWPARHVEERSLQRRAIDENFPIWLDRSRKMDELPQYPEPRDLEFLIEQAEKWVANLNPRNKDLVSDAIDIRSRHFILRVAFLNPLHKDWPLAHMFGIEIHPYNAEVRRAVSARPRNPNIMADWMIARLRRVVATPMPPLIDADDHDTTAPDPGVTEDADSAGGQLYMPATATRSPFAFGYRLMYTNRGSFPWNRRGTSRADPPPDIMKLFEDAGTTAFGSPVVDPERIPYPRAPAAYLRDRESRRVDMTPVAKTELTLVDLTLLTSLLGVLLFLLIYYS